MDKTIADTAVKYLQNKGWTLPQAQGIVANLHHESGFNTKAVGDSGTAFGVAQWRGPRVEQFRKTIGTPVQEASLMQQLDFVDWELRNTESKAGKALSKTKDPGTAADVFTRLYERPQYPDKDAAKRSATAIAYAGGTLPASQPTTAVASATTPASASATTPANAASATASSSKVDMNAMLLAALEDMNAGSPSAVEQPLPVEEKAVNPMLAQLDQLAQSTSAAQQQTSAKPNQSWIAALKNIQPPKQMDVVDAQGNWIDTAEGFGFDEVLSNATRDQDARLARMLDTDNDTPYQDANRLPTSVDRYLDKILKG